MKEKEKLPKFLAIKKAILAEIRSGKLSVNSQLPSREELQVRFDVAKETLGKALRELVRDGYLTAKRNAGTFVCRKTKPLQLAMISPIEAQSDRNLSNSLIFGFDELRYFLPYDQQYKLMFLDVKSFRTHPEQVSSCDGAFWMLPEESDFPLLRTLSDKVIAINRYGEGFNFISTNHFEAQKKITQEWLGKFAGRCSIFYLDVEDNKFVCRNRREGFIKACEEANAFYRIVPLSKDFESNVRQLEKLFLPSQPPPVLISPSHRVLGTVLRVAYLKNLKLQKDFYYSDFDFANSLESIGCRFPSVIQNHREMARTAIDAVSALGIAPIQKFIPFEILHFQ